MLDAEDLGVLIRAHRDQRHLVQAHLATALDQAGLSAREVAEYLGHENPSITQDVYMAKNTGGVRAAAALGGLLV